MRYVLLFSLLMNFVLALVVFCGIIGFPSWGDAERYGTLQTED
jgi:hypothetical protein